MNDWLHPTLCVWLFIHDLISVLVLKIFFSKRGPTSTPLYDIQNSTDTYFHRYNDKTVSCFLYFTSQQRWPFTHRSFFLKQHMISYCITVIMHHSLVYTIQVAWYHRYLPKLFFLRWMWYVALMAMVCSTILVHVPCLSSCGMPTDRDNTRS